MTYNQDIVEKLSLFNNISFTKKQWEIVLKGCGCPKSSHFWTALRDNNLQKEGKLYLLVNINQETFSKVWDIYCNLNRTAVNKCYKKKKVRASLKPISHTTFYVVNGVVTVENPKLDD